MNSPLPERTIAIDEEGYAFSGETRWTDPAAGGEVLSHLALTETGALVSRAGGVPVLVEAFDAPLVAVRAEIEDGALSLMFPYEIVAEADLGSLHVDEWDRFHGRTKDGIPFVLSRNCQAAFFDLVEEFDDESITIGGRRIATPPTYSDEAKISESGFWTEIYETEDNPRWNLAEPAKALTDMLPRLKLSKSRILVPGCGEGHDAALFAREGHVVTAVDFSAEAVRRAQALYGHLPNLRFVHADLFDTKALPERSFDVIFEHAVFCAVEPARRPELVRQWLRWLAPGGFLMGVFFIMDKRTGPPFGASEWELRRRLQKNFRFLFWGRWKDSLPRRRGRELFVYAQKTEAT